MRTLPLADVYKLLEPGPVVLLATARKGVANVMTVSWHMMVDFEPPLVACVVSDRNYSYRALKATRECVIAVPSARLARKVNAIGNCSGSDTDKFGTFGLTAIAGKRVAPPLIAECFANLECRTVDTGFVRKYGLFILEVLKAWHDPEVKDRKMIHHHGFGRYVIDGRSLTLSSKMR